MYRKRFSRGICAAAAMALLIAGCQSQSNQGQQSSAAPESGKTSSSPSTGSQTKDYTLPLVTDGSVTLTIGSEDNGYTPASYTQNLPIWKAIEEKTGVKIKWDVVPVAQYVQTMNVRLASMSNVPDLLVVPGDPVKFGTDGVLEPLEKLIEEHAPNMRKFFAENPDIYNLLKAPDGHVYYVSSVVTGTNLSDPGGFMIRKDWLDKLNLQEPKTIDEWYSVLKAIKDGDPNGNGKKDEIPLVLPLKAVAQFFGDAWGLHLVFSSGFWPDDKGKIQSEWLDPRAKEMVAWLNKLYKEGLLDPDFLTSSDDQLTTKITKNVVGSTRAFVNRIVQYDKNVQAAGVSGVNWIAVKPPQGPNGYKGHTEKYGPISGYFGMSAQSKNKETAIKWLDYVYASEEGNRFTTFGIEGKSYVMENGEPKFTDYILKNPDGLNSMNALRTLGAAPRLPWIRHDKGPLSKQPPQTIALEPKLQKAAEQILPTIIDPIPFEYISMTPEEASKFKPLNADYQSKLDEGLAKFIVGSDDIEKNWDTFTKELKDLGVDEIVKIRQQQYDRYKKQ
ncbi:extracellular solute-binding protein [Paenibacillus contaminans]|uniref:ABC transporter substrate-binding protein n=1 Tax=Paenibacillus contaminans TaxID=450362 RepID=A0A329MD11_9BACL|nr:extracellular solute-binding protein [Paenibacillus contaminans]RAV17871.1 hypothetical protein DQG23_26030 [Paenibacillus contaminans]